MLNFLCLKIKFKFNRFSFKIYLNKKKFKVKSSGKINKFKILILIENCFKIIKFIIFYSIF